MIEIVLAGAPMGKERVRVTRAGHAYTPKRTVNFESRLAAEAQRVMGDRPLLDGPLAVIVTAAMPIPESKPKKWKAAALAGVIRPIKKPDVDNFAKLVDSCNLIVWTDDAQIVELHSYKFYSDRPFLKIEARELGTGAFA